MFKFWHAGLFVNILKKKFVLGSFFDTLERMESGRYIMRSVLFTNKYESPSLVPIAETFSVVSERFHENDLRIPESVMICFSSRFMEYAISHYNLTSCDFWPELLLFEKWDQKIALLNLVNFSGAAATMHLERLVALGIHKFVSLVSLEPLNTQIAPGSLVIVKEAIRDEGVSSHYLPWEKIAKPSSWLVEMLTRRMKDLFLSYRLESSWTMDAPLMRKVCEQEALVQEGVLLSEEVIASLYVVATVRQVHMVGVGFVQNKVVRQDQEKEVFPETFGKVLEALFTTLKGS